MGYSGLAGGFDGQDIHAINRLARDAKSAAALEDLCRGGRALLRCAHGVLIVFNHKNDWKIPKGRHVKGFIDLALIGRAIAKIGKSHPSIAEIFIGKCEARTDGHLRSNDAMPPVEMLLFREHMHRAAFAFGVPAAAPGELGHNAVGFHTTGQHMAVIAVGGHALVALFCRRLEPHHHGFLADVEMTKATNQTHAIELACFFFKSPDQQHLAVVMQQIVFGDICLAWFFSRHRDLVKIV